VKFGLWMTIFLSVEQYPIAKKIVFFGLSQKKIFVIKVKGG
jgi:hypothetical protein